jgi:hypothetical protein
MRAPRSRSECLEPAVEVANPKRYRVLRAEVGGPDDLQQVPSDRLAEVRSRRRHLEDRSARDPQQPVRHHWANNSSCLVNAGLPLPRTCHAPADSTPKLLASPSRSNVNPAKWPSARLRNRPVINPTAGKPYPPIAQLDRGLPPKRLEGIAAFRHQRAERERWCDLVDPLGLPTIAVDLGSAAQWDRGLCCSATVCLWHRPSGWASRRETLRLRPRQSGCSDYGRMLNAP